MPLVTILKPDVDHASCPVHFKIEAVDGAERELEIFYGKVGLVQLEVTAGVRQYVAGEFGTNFFIPPDHILQIFLKCGAAAIDLVIEVFLSQWEQAHERIPNDAGDVARRKVRAATLHCHGLGRGGSI